MKSIISFVFILTMTINANSHSIIDNPNFQEKEFRISKSTGFLVVEGLQKIHVTGYDGNEIIITRNVKSEEEVDERAKGLKLVNSLGQDDNTGIGLNAKVDGDHVYISEVSSRCCDSEIRIQVPNGMSIDLKKNSMGGGNYIIENFKNEVVASTNYGSIILNNVTGPLAVKSVYGSVEAKMNSISQEGSISLYSVYGLVDVSIPSNVNADIDISTPYGEIYTDVDIKINESDEEYRRLSKREVQGKINSGGVQIMLNSSYSKVYLRKS